MPRCDGCGNNRCGCVLIDGDNTTVLGSGTSDDPFRVNATGGEGGAEFFPGFITPYAGGSAPTGWLLCDGSAVSRTTYATLFAICGETYGDGDGANTFNLPDLGGRFPLGADGPHARGSIGGAETTTLAVANLPAHDHTMAHTHTMAHVHSIAHDHAADDTSSNGNHTHEVKQSDADGTNNQTFRRGGSQDRLVDTSNDGAHTHTVNLPNFAGNSGGSSASSTGGSSAAETGETGSGTPVSNMPPYTAVSMIIKT